MSTLHRYRHYIGVLFDRGQRWRLVVATVGSIFIGLLDTGSVLLIAPLVTAMGQDWRSGVSGTIAEALGLETQSSLVMVLLAGAACGFVLKDLLYIAYSWWSLSFTAKVRSEAQIEMVRYYLHMPYHLHAHLGLATILRKTGTSVTLAYSTFMGGILALLSQSFTIVSITAALLISTPVVSSVLLAFLAIFGILFFKWARPLNDELGRETLNLSQESYFALFDAFGAIRETQLRHAYPYFLNAVAGPTRKMARIQRTGTFVSGLPKQLIEILFMTGLSVAFLVATALGSSASIMGSLALLVAGAFRLLPTIAAAMGSLAGIRQGEAGAREFVLDKVASRSIPDEDAPSRIDTAEPLPLMQAITLEDVTFRYTSTGPDVLKGASLGITAGSTVAFVGSSGAGKSTLLDIIMGLQTPTTGRLLVDGTDVQTNLVGWQRNISVVPQDVFLTDRTIAENVAFDSAPEDIDEDRARDALRQADILDFVKSQPEGIWSSFGERGRRLSGGQRQRIGIARALYRQPSVLILDEATSALDNETEARIAETIAALHGQITVIIVAHRLSTVKDADMIAYLADGKVEATGTFTELQERSNGFRRLVELATLEERG